MVSGSDFGSFFVVLGRFGYVLGGFGVRLWKLGGRSEKMSLKIVKIGTIWGPVARHGLIFGGNEAYHCYEAF